MRKSKKIIALAVAACLSFGTVGTLAGCGDGGFQYKASRLSEMENPAQDYNGNLFYVNSLEFQIADPSVIYVSEGKGQGWFYAYGTSDEIGGHGIQAWRSKDLSRWECTGIALLPDYGVTWASDCYWAPEVIYDAEEKLYYMFYNAYHQDEILGHRDDGSPIYRLCLSVAYSETPDGPFLTPTGRNSDGKQLSESEPVYDLHGTNPAIPQGTAMDCALDASPFIDPETGKKYLYFGWYNVKGDGTYLYGMEMKDWYTPDYSTLTKLTRPGYSSLAQSDGGGIRDRDSEGHINEGPHMIYHNGKYYLTFSVNDFESPFYRVIQSVADEPLGTYLKVPEEDGGKVISTDYDWTHMMSAGHHAFINVNGELFIAYHTFKNRLTIKGDGRALAVDRVVWTTNSEGTEVMHTNGPSYSLQPLPEAISGYKNIAPLSTVTADNSLSDGDEALLTDGMIKYQEKDLVTEYEADEGTSTITLTWDDFKTARAIMIYNSYDYFNAFESVKSVEIEYMKANGSTDTVTVKNVQYDNEWFADDEWEFMTPGGSAVLEFNEMPVKSIKITIDAKEESILALNEIVVLGKDEACEGIDSFMPYSYLNRQTGSAHLVKDSNLFGTIVVDGKESSLQTMYGYDLSHDDGTENAYITQSGVRDQYAFFKDIYATSFYAEAEFTVTENKPYAKDAFPKFGIAISCDDAVSSTLFYYVDAQNNFTLGQVGCAPRALGGDDWDWANENTKSVDISYTNGNTVKLAVLRQGAKFYFLCNDTLLIESSNFALFGDLQRAGVGFLTFNSPVKISKYSATADEAKVAEKLAQYVN